VIAELGHFPKQQELDNSCRYDLMNAIARNGGMNEFRTMLGHELNKKPNGYWTINTT